MYWGLTGAEGKLYFMERRDGKTRLMHFDHKEREAKSIVDDLSAYDLSANGKSLLLGKSGNWRIANASGKEGKKLAIAGFRVKVEPREEWEQILREAWRIHRDYFYDPEMHGVDWAAMWDRWSAFLPHVQHRSDLSLLLSEMAGELACGHNYVSGGDRPDPAPGAAVGLLGCDVAVTGDRYRISHIYRGQNWNPSLRAPLTAPGVDVNVGDRIVAVNGRPLTAADNFYAAFEGTVGKQVELTVTAGPGAESRTTTVVPISSEFGLRNREWIESNRRRVDELSGGRLAYIYMPNTGGVGMASFDRDFFSQLDKKGVVIDERFNGGGKVADYVIHVLKRRPLSYWMNREMWAGRSPFGVLTGPKVMIINERAGSGGDWMPWAFRNEGVGPLVGTRTWGGLVGISGYPTLMDGGSVTSASFGVMDTDGEWAVENVGVAPDYEVIQWPKEVIAGGDPQLERAVRIALDLLEKSEAEKLPEYHPPSPR